MKIQGCKLVGLVALVILTACADAPQEQQPQLEEPTAETSTQPLKRHPASLMATGSGPEAIRGMPLGPGAEAAPWLT